ncbi:MAG: hypothetical protein ACQEP8_00535 [Chlamydiota bacterium]
MPFGVQGEIEGKEYVEHKEVSELGLQDEKSKAILGLQDEKSKAIANYVICFYITLLTFDAKKEKILI